MRSNYFIVSTEKIAPSGDWIENTDIILLMYLMLWISSYAKCISHLALVCVCALGADAIVSVDDKTYIFTAIIFKMPWTW